jgi:hypothetical protein
MIIEPDKHYMRLAVTDRHYQDCPAEHFLLGTLSYRADAYKTAYETVMEWDRWNMFNEYDGVLLYLCSKITACIGTCDALDAIGVSYALLEYQPHKGTYRQVDRKRVAS